jgi:hypothetical protein
MLSGSVEISSFSATVRLHAVHRKGEEPYFESQPWLELRGTATEPVRVYPVKAAPSRQLTTIRPPPISPLTSAG